VQVVPFQVAGLVGEDHLGLVVAVDMPRRVDGRRDDMAIAALDLRVPCR
jgi:hypothetical protein